MLVPLPGVLNTGLLCACHGTHEEVMAHKRRSEDNLQSPLLSFYHVGLGNWTRVVRLGCKQPYPLSHLTGPRVIFFILPRYQSVIWSIPFGLSTKSHTHYLGIVLLGVKDWAQRKIVLHTQWASTLVRAKLGAQLSALRCELCSKTTEGSQLRLHLYHVFFLSMHIYDKV